MNKFISHYICAAFLFLIASTASQQAALCNDHVMEYYGEYDPTISSIAISDAQTKCVDKVLTVTTTVEETPGGTIYHCNSCDLYSTNVTHFDNYTYEYVWTKPDGVTVAITHYHIAGPDDCFLDDVDQAGKYTVKVTLTGYDSSNEQLGDPEPNTRDIDVTCCDCGNSGCAENPGDTTVRNKCVDVVISLGMKQLKAMQVGVLHLNEEQPSTDLATPDLLKYEGEPQGNGVDVVYVNGVLSQVKVPQGLADIQTIDSYKYEVRIYTNASGSTGGPYTPIGDMVSKTVIENPDGSVSTNNLKVSHIVGGDTKVSLFEWDPENSRWSLKTGVNPTNPSSYLKKERLTKQWDGDIRIETREILDGSSSLVKKTTQYYQTFGGIESLISQIEDPDSLALTTTNTYYDNGKLKQILRPDGSWEYYFYNTGGCPTTVYSTYGNQGPTTNSSLCRTVEYYYTPEGTGDDGSVRPSHPRKVFEKTAGMEISRTYYVILAGEEQEIRCPTEQAGWDNTNNLVTITKTYTSGAFIGKVQSIQRPDGTMDFYVYSDNEQGTERTTIVSSGEPNEGKTDISDGTVTVTMTGTAGETLTRTVTDYLTGIVIENVSYSDFDAFKRPGLITYLDGTQEQMTYACCGLDSKTDRMGVKTEYYYDELGRIFSTRRSGAYQVTSLDAAGRVISTSRLNTNGQGEITLSLTQYDLAGRPTAKSDALGAISTIAYNIDANGTTVTTTYTNSSTRIENYAKDGSLLELIGTAVQPVRYTNYVDDGIYEMVHLEVKLDADYEDTNEKIATYYDRVDRPYKTIYGAGTSVYSQDYYNPYGQRSKHVDPDGVTTLYLYNGKGELEYSGLDVNTNSVIDFGGSDRITQTVNDVVTNSTYHLNFLRTRTFVWATNNVNSSNLIASQEIAVEGLIRLSTQNDLVSQSQTTFTTNSGIVTVSVKNTAPDNTFIVNQSQNGLLLSTTSYSSDINQMGQTSKQYDEYNRLWKVTDARNGTTTYGYNNADQITTVTTPKPDDDQDAQTTINTYSDMGWLLNVDLPDNTTVTYEYYSNGALKKTYGSRTYPVEYQYDAQGRMTSMKTWQNTNGYAVTTWIYDSQRGWLTEKIYDDEQAGPSYTYTAGGRLLTRTWARGGQNQIVTTYSYNNSGDLESIDYSDSTPDVSLTYDRLGRMNTVARNSITTTLTYNSAGQLLRESYSGGSLALLSVTNVYDSILRRQQTTAYYSAVPRASQTYEYEENSSRLLTASSGDYSATYSYLENSPLVSQITFKNDDDTMLTTTKAYDKLNRLTNISSVPYSDSTISSSYLYNDANQRIRRLEPSNYYWTNQYDYLGQMTSSKKYNRDDVAITNRQYEYYFDNIGNRNSTYVNGTPTYYTPNLLNQYVSCYTGGSTIEFTHDDDGNLESDSLWTYTWDAENRLIQMQSQTSVPEEYRLKLTFEYDWQSRRIRKKVYVWDDEDYATTASTDIKYLYDGWNLIAELDDDNDLLRSYVWGLDLSGSPQGAGVVGGLVLFKNNTQTPTYHFPAYDGNGNVMALVAASGGSVTAQYEYSPFGETLSATGGQAAYNPFRFSSKYTDDETGLLYYGYRYYNPSTGRWPSRDPMGEYGGLNLYGYVFNSPVNWIDPLGLGNFPVPRSTTCAEPNPSNPRPKQRWGPGQMPEDQVFRAIESLKEQRTLQKITGIGPARGGPPVRAAETGQVSPPLQTLATQPNSGIVQNTPPRIQLEFPFARGASVQTPGITTAGETFVRVGASFKELNFSFNGPGGTLPRTYAMPVTTFDAIGRDPAVLQSLLDMPGSAPLYYRYLQPPPGTLIQRGIVPGGEFGGVGGVPEVRFPNGF